MPYTTLPRATCSGSAGGRCCPGTKPPARPPPRPPRPPCCVSCAPAIARLTTAAIARLLLNCILHLDLKYPQLVSPVQLALRFDRKFQRFAVLRLQVGDLRRAPRQRRPKLPRVGGIVREHIVVARDGCAR